MNKKQTMKQQRSGTSIHPSRVCQLLLVALAFKFILVGSMAYDTFIDPSIYSLAHAAEASGAPAAPSTIKAPLPDAGMGEIQSRGGNNAYTPATSQKERTLPPLGSRRGVGTTPDSTELTVEEDFSNEERPASSDSALRSSLTRKQDELARKEEELKALEKEVAGKLDEMKVLEGRLQVMMKEAKGTTDAKLRHLVDVLSNMKARQAAEVLETLDSRIAVKVLANMRGKQAGEILTYVNAEKAASLAESLARMQMPME